MGDVFQNEAVGGELGHLGALHVHLAAVRRQHAGDHLGQLALAVAVHAGDAHDLPPAHGQGDAVESRVLGGLVVVHVPQLDHRVPRLLHLLIVRGRQLPADHQVGQLLAVGLGTVQGGDHLPGPQDGDAVGDLQHLPHLVADEDDALALLRQLADDLEQTLHLNVRQGGGGLVQDQQLRSPVQCLQDLHPLLGAHGDLRDGLVQLHVQAVPLRQLQDLFLPGLLVDEDPLGVPVPQNDVLKHRHGLHQHEVLVHHADAQLHRLGRGVDADLLPVEEDLPLRGLVQSNEDVHQRALSGAVLPQQGMYLALADGQVDVPVGVKVAEPLADVLHSQ